jgi:hypothetical protein
MQSNIECLQNFQINNFVYTHAVFRLFYNNSTPEEHPLKYFFYPETISVFLKTPSTT